MKTVKILMALIFIAASNFSNAQKIKWESGEDLAFMKDVKSLNIEYDFNNMTVAEGTESTFLEERKAAMNKDKAGEGDEFVMNWEKAKTEKYPKHFEELFNKELRKESIVGGQKMDAQYTVIITVTNVKTGRGNAWGKKPAMVDFVITIVETNNHSTILAKATMEDVKGEVKAPKGSNWAPSGVSSVLNTTAHFVNKDVTNRLAESYELVAIALAKQIKKKN